jgi:hypothetical protein
LFESITYENILFITYENVISVNYELLNFVTYERKRSACKATRRIEENVSSPRKQDLKQVNKDRRESLGQRIDVANEERTRDISKGRP